MDGGKISMKRSLQRHLSLVLGATILLAGLVAAIASFSLAYLEAKELQDDMLRQIATLSPGNNAHSLFRNPEQDTANGEFDDPESRFTIYHFPLDVQPAWLSRELLPGLHTVDAGTERLRVFVRDDKAGKRTVVTQLTDARDEIAINSALRTLVPLLLLFPVLVWLIVRIIRSELAPIIHLSRRLDEQSADNPHPLADDNLPQEITPFVSAINRLLGRVNLLVGQQRRFIADAAHELRSPLAALSLQAQNLLNAGSLDAMRERAVPLQAGIERAIQLTEQLLNLARTQASNHGVDDINVSVKVREMIAEYLPKAEAKHIDLGLDESEAFSMKAPPEVLTLIIRNALENALKYTPDGGEVTVRLRNHIDDVVIEVIDNGPGIPRLERESVFESFYRIPGTAGVGSGLGLAIAREASNRLGGTVSLHDKQQGHGLVFRYQHRR